VDAYPIGANSCESGSAVLASRFRFFSVGDPVIAALNKLYELQQRVKE